MDGRIPFDDLPWQFDPEDGVIVTANNAAVDANYPHFVAQEWDPGFRAERILDQIGLYGDDGLTVDEMRRIQYDDSPLAPRDIIPLIEEVSPPGTDDGTTIASRIATGRARATRAASDAPHSTRGSTGSCATSSMTIWARSPATTSAARSRGCCALASSRRSELRVVGRQPDGGASRRLPNTTVARAMDEAGSELRAAFGSPDGWSWGRIDTATFREATLGTSGIGPLEWYFNEGPRAVPGPPGPSITRTSGTRPHIPIDHPTISPSASTTSST